MDLIVNNNFSDQTLLWHINLSSSVEEYIQALYDNPEASDAINSLLEDENVYHHLVYTDFPGFYIAQEYWPAQTYLLKMLLNKAFERCCVDEVVRVLAVGMDFLHTAAPYVTAIPEEQQEFIASFNPTKENLTWHLDVFLKRIEQDFQNKIYSIHLINYLQRLTKWGAITTETYFERIQMLLNASLKIFIKQLSSEDKPQKYSSASSKTIFGIKNRLYFGSPDNGFQMPHLNPKYKLYNNARKILRFSVALKQLEVNIPNNLTQKLQNALDSLAERLIHIHEKESLPIAEFLDCMSSLLKLGIEMTSERKNEIFLLIENTVREIINCFPDLYNLDAKIALLSNVRLLGFEMTQSQQFELHNIVNAKLVTMEEGNEAALDILQAAAHITQLDIEIDSATCSKLETQLNNVLEHIIRHAHSVIYLNGSKTELVKNIPYAESLQKIGVKTAIQYQQSLSALFEQAIEHFFSYYYGASSYDLYGLKSAHNLIDLILLLDALQITFNTDHLKKLYNVVTVLKDDIEARSQECADIPANLPALQILVLDKIKTLGVGRDILPLPLQVASTLFSHIAMSIRNYYVDLNREKIHDDVSLLLLALKSLTQVVEKPIQLLELQQQELNSIAKIVTHQLEKYYSDESAMTTPYVLDPIQHLKSLIKLSGKFSYAEKNELETQLVGIHNLFYQSLREGIIKEEIYHNLVSEGVDINIALEESCCSSERSGVVLKL